MLGKLLKSLLVDRTPVIDRFEHTLADGCAAYQQLDFMLASRLLADADALRALDADRLSMLGTSQLYSGRLEAAAATLQRVLVLQPGHVEARKMLAMKTFLSGRLREAFVQYEACRDDYIMQTPEQRLSREWLLYVLKATRGIPLWQGEPLTGKRILLWSEYGHGDAIMHLRFLPFLRDPLGASEIAFLSVPAEQCLFEALGEQRFFASRVDWVAPEGAFDYHASIISLPYWFKVDLDSVPAEVPYLRVPAEKAQPWTERLAGVTELKVGLSWAGNPDMPLDPLRSVPIEALAPLFAVTGVLFFSLQKDRRSRDALVQHALPVVDLMDHVGDFMDTAGLMQHLDLVISVDTALAHLAGATGRPVWVLNRFESEWRWMRNREDSPWYPTLRLFNQTEPRNWTPVIRQLADALQRHALDTGH